MYTKIQKWTQWDELLFLVTQGFPNCHPNNEFWESSFPCISAMRTSCENDELILGMFFRNWKLEWEDVKNITNHIRWIEIYNWKLYTDRRVQPSFWLVTLSSWVEVHQSFGGMLCICLQQVCWLVYHWTLNMELICFSEISNFYWTILLWNLHHAVHNHYENLKSSRVTWCLKYRILES